MQCRPTIWNAASNHSPWVMSFIIGSSGASNNAVAASNGILFSPDKMFQSIEFRNLMGLFDPIDNFLQRRSLWTEQRTMMVWLLAFIWRFCARHLLANSRLRRLQFPRRLLHATSADKQILGSAYGSDAECFSCCWQSSDEISLKWALTLASHVILATKIAIAVTFYCEC